MWEDLPRKLSLMKQSKMERFCDICDKKVGSVFDEFSGLIGAKVHLVTTRIEMRERIGAGECIAFDSLAFLGTKQKKLYPRFQVVVLGRRCVQKTLFLQHLAQSGQDEDFCEPPLSDTQVVGKELVVSFLPSVYRLWPKVNDQIRCVELFDLEQMDVNLTRLESTWLWAGSEEELLSDGTALAQRYPKYSATFVVLTQMVPDEYEPRIDLGNRTDPACVWRYFYNPEKSSDELMRSWHSRLDDDPKNALRLITASICRRCGPTYSTGACFIV